VVVGSVMNDETSRKRKLKTGGSWRWEMIGRHWIGYILREKERRGEGEEEGEKEKKKGRRRRRRGEGEEEGIRVPRREEQQFQPRIKVVHFFT